MSGKRSRGSSPGAQYPVKRPLGTVGKIVAQSLLVLWAVTVVLPFVWTGYSSLKTSAEIMISPFGLPEVPQWHNYVNAWVTGKFGHYFLNTVIVVVVGMLGVLALSSVMAFAIAKFEFRGKRLLMTVMLVTMVFPAILSLIPLYFLMMKMHLLDSLWGLGLLYAVGGMPFTVIFLVAFFRLIPDELIEAARLDGCSYWGTFFRVMLPLARPGLFGVGIFQFMGMWNQYILPLVMTQSPEKYVLGLGVARLAVNQGYYGDFGAMFAGIMISLIPVLVMYLLFQKNIQAGMISGAVKS